MLGIKSALILGVHSFSDVGKMTGIQHIACGLAKRGIEVDYISVPSSPFDLIDQRRRKRFRRVWGDKNGFSVGTPMQNLHEYSFRSWIPVHRLFAPFHGMLTAVRTSAPAWFHSREYDLCIHDVGPTMAYLRKEQAKHHVLRLNDAPDGFQDMPGELRQRLAARIKAGFYRQIWAVSEPLIDYARNLSLGAETMLIPNGCNCAQLKNLPKRPESLQSKKAIYLGDNCPWLDVEIVRKTARLMPDWEFHFVGSGYQRERGMHNLKFFPPTPHDQVKSLLEEYAVGLLPYKQNESRMNYVRIPLKFYEYYACGLGVACIDIESLREGLKDMASYGSTPETFAEAILRSVQSALTVVQTERDGFIAANDWSVRLDEMCDALASLTRVG